MKVLRYMAAATLALVVGLVSTVSASDPPAGEVLFKAQKCIMCHKYQTPDPKVEVIPDGPPNLWNIGDRRKAEWIIPYVKKESEIEGRKHKVIWKGKPEDLVVVANWLVTLKDPLYKAPDTTKSETLNAPKAEPSNK